MKASLLNASRDLELSRPERSLPELSRRQMLLGTMSACGVAVASGWGGSIPELQAATPTDLKGRLYKTLKIGMVKVPGSLTEKFAAVKEAGFHGIELNAPGLDIEEVKQAIAATGLPVDGTVCSSHWAIRHTSPDAGERKQALEDLLGAIRQTHAIGGNTVLLVVGHGKDGPEEEIRSRSVENIRQALPLAADLGV